MAIRVQNPDGSTRLVDAANPGDTIVGAESPLDLISDAGEAPAAVPVPQVLNPGQDESAPSTAVAPIFRRTTAPRTNPLATRVRNTTRPIF